MVNGGLSSPPAQSRHSLLPRAASTPLKPFDCQRLKPSGLSCCLTVPLFSLSHLVPLEPDSTERQLSERHGGIAGGEALHLSILHLHLIFCFFVSTSKETHPSQHQMPNNELQGAETTCTTAVLNPLSISPSTRHEPEPAPFSTLNSHRHMQYYSVITVSWQLTR